VNGLRHRLGRAELLAETRLTAAAGTATHAELRELGERWYGLAAPDVDEHRLDELQRRFQAALPATERVDSRAIQGVLVAWFATLRTFIPPDRLSAWLKAVERDNAVRMKEVEA
jgi:hypothetical protein